VLTAILFFSAVGGRLSDHIGLRTLTVLLMILIGLGLLSFALAPAAIHRMLGLTPAGRVLASLLLIAPPSLLMGFPFPAAMRLLLAAPPERAYGWAANGSTSVLTSIIAVQVALSLGISRLFLAGALAYLVALAVLSVKGRTPAGMDQPGRSDGGILQGRSKKNTRYAKTTP